jgi:hypothetical protein
MTFLRKRERSLGVINDELPPFAREDMTVNGVTLNLHIPDVITGY